MSGRGSYVPARRMLLALALLLGMSLALYVVAGFVFSRQVVPLETANYPYRANVSGGVKIMMGPGIYTVTLRLDEGVTGSGRVCCAAASTTASEECINLSSSVSVPMSCDGPGVVVCYNVTVPAMHPRVGIVEVSKAWP